MIDLAGKAALITGGSRGIGRAIALRLAGQGADVAFSYRGNEEAAKGTVADLEALGRRAVAIQGDVRDPESADAVVKAAIEAFGKIDILVNNAGITRDRSFKKLTKEAWDEVITTDLTSVFLVTKHLIDPMAERGWGRVINMSSIVGEIGNFGQANYAAAKAGLIGLTKTLAREYARKGVTVNAVAPIALTRMTENLGPAPETDEEREARSPAWIAPIATWLASEESAGVTGRVFEASGQFLAVAEGWVRGPRTEPIDDPTKLGPVVADLLAKARPNSGVNGDPGGWPQPQP